MILLETNNFLLEETLTKRFSAEKREELNIKLVDFDSVIFLITTPEGNRDQIIVSIHGDVLRSLFSTVLRIYLARSIPDMCLILLFLVVTTP
ncbi:Actin- protein 2/3 complex subunit 2 [Entomophthora muscae]|uniref:Actin- protein 2/3 complex subunit 2 n=1 Tax=Entomophthora muscae TaxID=34485 RepID=A0ACC2SPI8_9FUNG|nr:Actin- protein 2/3 complex subunit 2 [Entomophthora muscae]